MSEIISISSNSLTASIDTMGAQLMSLRKGESEYLWQGDSNWWPRRAPILFPIVGVLKDSKAESAEGTISLARHGLARLNQFEVVEQSPSSVTLQLKSTEETRKSYPYDFELKLIFSVDGDTLTQTYEVTNPANVVLPFTLGAHPAFNIPIPDVEASSLNHYHLLFTHSWTSYGPSITDEGLCDYTTPQRLIVDSDTLPLSWELIDREKTITLENVPDRRITLAASTEAPSEAHGIQMDFEGFDYLGIWSATPGCPFVALEPWCGIADTVDCDGIFEHKPGIISLEPGQSIAKTLNIRVF
ncbi:aldose 1-epimerase [Atopobium sp. BS2]|uniref:aldose 1-epimerase family protein n=1 Tax=Atopobium sp. BS2 TaxID=936550 RepID=UPI000445FE8F|nr:aldose 1-epimerase family protein [Atopobium sp. BS2]EWC92850.1 aldose 1-epimerase [Atopobium sp. BS2]